MMLTVQQAALLMTIQDGGRYGYQRFGMPESGPMDWWAFRTANQLVGNDPGAACVEIGFSSAAITLDGRCLLAACGVGYRLFVNQHEIPLWMAFLVKRGDRLRLEKITGGNFVYLAAAGGIQSTVWMGSRSYNPAAGLGHQLVEGEFLPLSADADETGFVAGRTIPESARPAYAQQPLIRVVPGPHQDRFQPTSYEALWSHPYEITPQSNRMGFRLDGPALAHRTGADLVSQGMTLGEIQVPGDGQPIVMMPDHPTTGGYTCIGTVAMIDLPLLAQVEPGCRTLRFTPVDMLGAQSAWVETIKQIDAVEGSEEDVWFGL